MPYLHTYIVLVYRNCTYLLLLYTNPFRLISCFLFPPPFLFFLSLFIFLWVQHIFEFLSQGNRRYKKHTPSPPAPYYNSANPF
ncbi:hypothetical protein F4810DRAFT_675668 [Camillea tinctor]|nr:hypothetical protein F4810DRAFT_675668 [Camillea tinctor]